MSEIRVDNITDEAGTGSPSLPNGLVTPSATVSGDIDLGGALTNGGIDGTKDIGDSDNRFKDLYLSGGVRTGSGGIISANNNFFDVVTLSDGEFATIPAPTAGIYAMTQAGFSGDAVIFSLKFNGGSQNVTIISNSPSWNGGGTSEPSSGGRGALWVESGVGFNVRNTANTTLKINFSVVVGT